MMDFNLPALMTKKMMLSWIELRNYPTRICISVYVAQSKRSSPPMRARSCSITTPAGTSMLGLHACCIHAITAAEKSRPRSYTCTCVACKWYGDRGSTSSCMAPMQRFELT
jgi:hypothetical protein